MFWLAMYLLVGDFAFRVHASWFDLDRHIFEVMNYYGMAFLKMVAIIFFVIPHIGLKIVLRKVTPV